MNKTIALIIFFSIVLASNNQEALIKDIKQSLMSPCCYSGTVYDHGNAEMESQIEEFVYEGRTKKEIMDYYNGLYGERILAVPVASGFNLFAWLGPIIIAGLGVLIFILYFRTSRQAPSPVDVTAADISYDDQIEKELKELDS